MTTNPNATLINATVRYATVWTDATVVAGTNVKLNPALMTQAMSTFAPAGGGGSTSVTGPGPSSQSVLAPPA
jgi:hypothetical protein